MGENADREAGTAAADASGRSDVIVAGQDEESRLRLLGLRLETQETQRKLEKLSLEIDALRREASAGSRWLELAKAATGPVAVLGLVVSAVLGAAQLRIATEARLEDRYQREVTHLGSKQTSERLTGVAGLSLILKDPSEAARRRVEAATFLVNALAVEQDATVRAALVGALMVLPGTPEGNSLVPAALRLLVDRNRDLTSLHDFTPEELTPAGFEKSSALGPVAGTSQLIAAFIRSGGSLFPLPMSVEPSKVPRGMDLSHISCVGCDFSRGDRAVDLSYVDFSGAILTAANFSGAILRDAKFVDSLLMGTSFVGADLHGADLRPSWRGQPIDMRHRLSRPTASGRRLEERSVAIFDRYWDGDGGERYFPDFACADLRNAQLAGRVLLGEAFFENGEYAEDSVDFVGTDLDGADLTDFQVVYMDRSAPGIGSWQHLDLGVALGSSLCGSLKAERADQAVAFCVLPSSFMVRRLEGNLEPNRFSALVGQLAAARHVSRAKVGLRMRQLLRTPPNPLPSLDCAAVRGGGRSPSTPGAGDGL